MAANLNYVGNIQLLQKGYWQKNRLLWLYVGHGIGYVVVTVTGHFHPLIVLETVLVQVGQVLGKVLVTVPLGQPQVPGTRTVLVCLPVNFDGHGIVDVRVIGQGHGCGTVTVGSAGHVLQGKVAVTVFHLYLVTVFPL